MTLTINPPSLVSKNKFMKTHLHQIITAKNNDQYINGVNHQIQDAIAAAFWAGESKARAEERESNRIAAKNAPNTRYRGIVAKTLESFNLGAVEGLRDESSELLGWDFELTQ